METANVEAPTIIRLIVVGSGIGAGSAEMLADASDSNGCRTLPTTRRPVDPPNDVVKMSVRGIDKPIEPGTTYGANTVPGSDVPSVRVKNPPIPGEPIVPTS